MPTASQSLQRRNSPLADANEQLRILNQQRQDYAFPEFLQQRGIGQLKAQSVETLQVNLGKLCNMTCRHCHVDAGPDRREIMTRETIDHCLNAIRLASIKTVDLTGGAPEMNPGFEHFVTTARQLGAHVIDRCNLTILLANGFRHLPEFLAAHEVEIVASLPCYLEENTDAQRGDGAYRESIEALQRLNELGYGQPGSALQLSLVYNPVGPTLPPDERELESQYRTELDRLHGIRFTRLHTITNMPISRFLEDLLESGQYEAYMQQLIQAFNPRAMDGLMCRQLISVGWDGQLYDCDFNQMLEIGLAHGLPQHIRDFDVDRLTQRRVMVGQHCFGCTAGSGSSCRGAIVDSCPE